MDRTEDLWGLRTSWVRKFSAFFLFAATEAEFNFRGAKIIDKESENIHSSVLRTMNHIYLPNYGSSPPIVGEPLFLVPLMDSPSDLSYGLSNIRSCRSFEYCLPKNSHWFWSTRGSRFHHILDIHLCLTERGGRVWFQKLGAVQIPIEGSFASTYKDLF